MFSNAASIERVVVSIDGTEMGAGVHVSMVRSIFCLGIHSSTSKDII